MKPVIFPPGWGRLATKLSPTGYRCKYDRDRPGLPLQCGGRWGSVCENYVRLEAEQLFCRHPHPVNVTGSPTNVYPHVAAIGPTQLRKSLHEPREVGFSLAIVFIVRHQNADLSRAVGLLGQPHHRPRRRAPESRNELPPSHPRSPRLIGIAYRAGGLMGTGQVSPWPLLSLGEPGRTILRV
jgi:hypothetical protein